MGFVLKGEKFVLKANQTREGILVKKKNIEGLTMREEEES